MRHLFFSMCALIIGALGFVSCLEDDTLEKLYTVTFDTDGGSEVEAQSVKAGELVVKPEDPVKENSYFGGWFVSKSYEKEWNFDEDIVMADMTLFAKWIVQENACVISFETNGGAELNPVYVEKGETVSSLPTPEKEGFEFDAWYMDANLSVKFDMSSAIVENLTLFAGWKVSEGTDVKEMLAELVKKVENIKEEDYNVGSFRLMTIKLIDARKVLENTSATDEELTSAYNKLDYVLQNMTPAIKGEKGPQHIEFRSYSGWTWLNGDVIYINPDRNGYYSVILNVRVDDELYVQSQEYYESVKWSYDEELLKQWQGSQPRYEIDESESALRFWLYGSIEHETKETSVTVSAGSVSKTVKLVLCDYNMAKEKVSAFLDTLPQEITFDNAKKCYDVRDMASYCRNYLGSYQNFEDAAFMEEVNNKIYDFKQKFNGWIFMPHVVKANDDFYSVNGGVYKYESEGEFPLGKLYSDWMLEYDYPKPTEENPNPEPIFKDASMVRYDFMPNNKLVRNYYLDSKGEWTKEIEGEYRLDGDIIALRLNIP